MSRVRRHGALILAACASIGCGAQRAMFHPSRAERQLLAEPPIDLSVAVVQWRPGSLSDRKPSVYAEATHNLLAGSRAFRSVTYDSASAALADLLAESNGDYCNTAMIPLYTIVTLGLWPTIWREPQCDGVVFRRRGAPGGGEAVVVRLKGEGTAILGWLAAPVGLFPGWSYRTGHSQKSYRQAFRLAVIARRDDLVRLARP